MPTKAEVINSLIQRYDSQIVGNESADVEDAIRKLAHAIIASGNGAVSASVINSPVYLINTFNYTTTVESIFAPAQAINNTTGSIAGKYFEFENNSDFDMWLNINSNDRGVNIGFRVKSGDRWIPAVVTEWSFIAIYCEKLDQQYAITYGVDQFSQFTTASNY